MTHDLNILLAHLGAVDTMFRVTDEPPGHKRVARESLAECRRIARKLDAQGELMAHLTTETP